MDSLNSRRESEDRFKQKVKIVQETQALANLRRKTIQENRASKEELEIAQGRRSLGQLELKLNRSHS